MAHHRRLSHVFLLLVLALAVTLSLPTPSPAQGSANLPPDLQALVEEALQANPEVKQMRSTFKASKETIRSAGALDDPEVAFSMKDIPMDTWALLTGPHEPEDAGAVAEISLSPASAACAPKWPRSRPIPMNTPTRTRSTRCGPRW